MGQGGQSYDEYVSQFQAWSVISAPLIVGLDVRSASSQYLQLLTNPGALAINQDPLGQSGNLVRRGIDGTSEVWAKALSTNTSSVEEERSMFKRTTDAAGQLRNSISRGLVSGARLPGRYRISNSINANASAPQLPVSNFHPWRYHAVLLLNRASYAQNLTVDFYSDLFDNFMCPHAPPPTAAFIRDAWHGTDIGQFDRTYTAANVPAHGSVLLTVRLIGE